MHSVNDRVFLMIKTCLGYRIIIFSFCLAKYIAYIVSFICVVLSIWSLELMNKVMHQLVFSPSFNCNGTNICFIHIHILMRADGECMERWHNINPLGSEQKDCNELSFRWGIKSAPIWWNEAVYRHKGNRCLHFKSSKSPSHSYHNSANLVTA